MSWNTIYQVVLFSLLIFIIIYFLLLYLQTGGFVLSLGVAILWAILLPLLSGLPYSVSYLVCLPSPIFGSWLLIMIMIEKYIALSVFPMLLAFLLSLFLVLSLHVLTRDRTMLWRIPMASLNRSSIAIVSVVFLGLGVLLVTPSALAQLSTPNEIFYLSAVLLGYISSSMVYINSSYRLYAISKRLNLFNLENELSKRWKQLQEKYPNQQDGLDLLQYYWQESLRCFIEGDFERSFIWGYKVIREKTLVNPTDHINDKRTNKPSLSEIRNTMEHSRREGHVGPAKIRQVIKTLFHDCLDLLEREFQFIEKISSNSQI